MKQPITNKQTRFVKLVLIGPKIRENSELVVGFDEQFLIYLLTVTIPLSTPSAVTQCGK